MTDAPCDDPIVEASVAMLRDRSRAGTAKYGTTLADSPERFDAFLKHLAEELADALNYTEKLRTLRQSSDIPDPRDALIERMAEGMRYYAKFFGIGGPILPSPAAYDAFQCLAAYREWKGTKP